MAPSRSRLAALLPFASLVLADGSPVQVTDSDCDCFMTSGEVTSYFSNHMFFDFRSLSQFASTPSIVSDLDGARDATATSDFFTSSAFSDAFSLQNWNNSGKNPFGGANYMMMNSFSNVYIATNNDTNATTAASAVSDTYLVMRTTKLDSFQSAAEFQTNAANFKHLSMRMFARTAGGAGACTAMFTYREDKNVYDVQEGDVEILTSGPDDVVQYTNQPSYTEDGKTVDESTVNATMPQGVTWSDWVEYRYDWTDGLSSWYVNGEHVSSIEFQAPKDPASLIINAWGDGGDWTGTMKTGDQALLQIQWFEVVYNTSGKATSKRDVDFAEEETSSLLGRLWNRGWGADWPDGAGVTGSRLAKRGQKRCAKVCSIDETNITGTPVLLYDSPAPVTRAGWGLVTAAAIGAGLCLLG